jgi:hypothetical protein
MKICPAIIISPSVYNFQKENQVFQITGFRAGYFLPFFQLIHKKRLPTRWYNPIPMKDFEPFSIKMKKNRPGFLKKGEKNLPGSSGLILD